MRPPWKPAGWRWARRSRRWRLSPAKRADESMTARILLLTLSLAWASLVFWNCAKPLPPGTHIASQTSRAAESDVDFLYESPQRATPKGDDMAAIDRAEQLIVLDRSPVTRPLALRLM